MRLSNNVIKLDCANRSYVYLVQVKTGWVMIDTGFPKLSSKIIAELSSYNIKPNDIKFILLTHGDVDHIGNLRELLNIFNCKVYADASEIPYLAKKKSYGFRKWLFKILLHIPKFNNVIPLPVPEIESIKIIRTPGHTPEHVCYVYQDFLFAGDLICTEDNSFSLLPDKYVFNKLQNIDSIKSLRVNNINWVCPAHGEPIRSSKNWSEFINKL